MPAALEKVGNAVGDAVGAVGNAIGNVVSSVGNAVFKLTDFVVDRIIDPVLVTTSAVIQSALDNPVKTAAQFIAAATGNAWALPLIEGADVAAKGGDVGDVLVATARAYVAQEIGSYVGGNATTAVAEATDSAIAGQIFGSGAASASVAIVSGQDPLRAFITGGVGAATGAVLGQVDQATNGNYSKLPKTVQAAIQSAITAHLSGNPNPTAAIIGSVISASGIVTNTITAFDPTGTKLDATQRTILTDVLMGTATAALSGGKASHVIQAAMVKAGSKALGDMAVNAFKSATAPTDAAYKTADAAANRVDENIAEQKTAAVGYNGAVTGLQARVTEQNNLIAAYDSAVQAFNANPSEANGNAAKSALATYNNYATQLNTDYNKTYQPQLTAYGAELDRLKQEYAVKTGDYEKAVQAFGTKTDTLSDTLDPVYRTSNRAFVEAMDEKFNALQYRTLNGLAADQDPYEHFLSKGQFENAPTNDKAAEPVIAQERTRLITAALTAKGVTMATADPAMVSKIIDNLDADYGNDVNALKAASAQDVIDGNTTLLNKLVEDQRNGTFRVDINGQSYGAWKQPEGFTPPAGMKLASFENMNSGKASTIIDNSGRYVWVERDPNSAIARWNPVTGDNDNTLPETYIYGKAPTEQEIILAMAELSGDDAVNGVVSQAMINAAKTVVGWAQQSGNSTLINTTANVWKATGGFLESINGISVLMGVAPSTTSMGKFANTLNELGKASNTTEYRAAVKNMNALIGDAKGVGGTLKAIYGAFESAPLQFLAEYVGVEGIQEIAPLLIGGVVSAGVKGAVAALKYGRAVAAKMGTAAGMTARTMTDITEAAGGAASGAYNETYKTAIKVGKSPAEADKIAMEVAQRQAFVAAAVAAVSRNLGGAALEKALLGRAGTGLGEAMQALGDFAKTGTKIVIKEGVSESGEEGITQAALEGQLYKLDNTRDVAKEITQATAFGFIAGGPIAGGAYGATRTGDVISNAVQGNPFIANILETNKGNPAAADAALGLFVDDTVKANLMNTIDNANYTSSAEAAVALGSRTDYTYSDADVTALTGKGTDMTLDSRAEAYVDPKVFDIDEAKAAAAAEGYTLTDEEAANLVGQNDEAAAAATIAEFDPRATTYDEAKGFLTAQGYTPSADEIKQFIGNNAETKAQTDVAAYVNPRQVTFGEANKYLTDQGYTPSDADVDRFVGQVNEADQANNIAAWVDPRTVNAQEVIDAYVALGLNKPTQDDVNKLMGQYDESGLAGKVETYLPTARFNSIMERLDAMGTSPDAKAAIDLVKSDLTKQIGDLGFKTDTQTGTIVKDIGELGKKVSDVESNILTKMADYEKAGIGRGEALGKAIDDVAADLGTTKTDLLTQLSTTEANMKAELSGTKTELKTDINTAKQEVLDKAAEYEKAGISRDEALARAQADMSKTLGQDTQKATQTDLDAVIKMLETQGAYDQKYDYNGDKVIDLKDKIAIETYLESQKPTYKPDTNDPFTYDPSAGSKWARTGVFKTIEDEAVATRQAQAADAARTRQAQAASAVKTQRLGNLNNMMNMLGQSEDIGGQQVTVKAVDPAKIGYVYDFDSIFANPSQEKMFVSPFARGGLVDGSEDVNDELLKFLKG